MLKLLHCKRIQLPILLLIVGILTGCGQKGDLYLPTEQPATQSVDHSDTSSEDQPTDPDPDNPE